MCVCVCVRRARARERASSGERSTDDSKGGSDQVSAEVILQWWESSPERSADDSEGGSHDPSTELMAPKGKSSAERSGNLFVLMCGCGCVHGFADVRADLFGHILKGMVCFQAMSWLLGLSIVEW